MTHTVFLCLWNSTRVHVAFVIDLQLKIMIFLISRNKKFEKVPQNLVCWFHRNKNRKSILLVLIINPKVILIYSRYSGGMLPMKRKPPIYCLMTKIIKYRHISKIYEKFLREYSEILLRNENLKWIDNICKKSINPKTLYAVW
jgi:hypothetical protein